MNETPDDWEDEGAPAGTRQSPCVPIALVPGTVRVDTGCWPGDAVSLRARSYRGVGSRGLAVAVIVERVDASDSLDAPDGGGGALLPARAGVTLAPGESTWVETSFPASREGPFRAVARVAPENGVTAAEGLADTAIVAARTRASPAVIQEIAFHDAGAGEWVELWIREPMADVGHLSLADASSSPRALARGESPRPIGVGAILVIAQNTKQSARETGQLALVLGVAGGWASLNDGNGAAGFADIVRVLAAGYPSDVVPYDARSVTRGGTLERLSPDLPGHLTGTWAECIDPARATPGRANSLRAPDRSLGTRGALLVASARVLRRSPPPPRCCCG